MEAEELVEEVVEEEEDARQARSQSKCLRGESGGSGVTADGAAAGECVEVGPTAPPALTPTPRLHGAAGDNTWDYSVNAGVPVPPSSQRDEPTMSPVVQRGNGEQKNV